MGFENIKRLFDNNQSKAEIQAKKAKGLDRQRTLHGRKLLIGATYGFGVIAANMIGQVDGSSNATKQVDAVAKSMRENYQGQSESYLADVVLGNRSNQTEKAKSELIEYFGKFMKNPEKFIENIENREIKQKLRQLARDVAKEHPDLLESVRNLFEERNETTLDIGTERLAPERLDPEVWHSMRKMLLEKTDTRRELNDNTNTAVVLVHGFSGGIGTDDVNCKGGYWGDAIRYLKAGGYSDIRTVAFYDSATNCDVDLRVAPYSDPCLNTNNSGSEGTNNEDLDHVSCKLAQYLYQNFGKSNKKVILVGHSLGGILIRRTMRLVSALGKSENPVGFPPTIGHVTDAVTLNAPHSGVASYDALDCRNCLQAQQLTAGSTFMNDLIQNAQNPQTSAGFTQWTVVGSECDRLMTLPGTPDGAASAIAMDASHAIMYSSENPKNPPTCYDHGEALGDSSTKNDATLYYCDTTPNVPCGKDYQNKDATVTQWKKTTTGSRGLQTLYGSVGR
jgi:hypothetical protein